ncbi:MAG: hypothetical protein APR55_08165 [Methanolinea sp. SDB]|nr:MAG: hypothetical protein APR55_08165 [Methanolinea sp. SDB]
MIYCADLGRKIEERLCLFRQDKAKKNRRGFEDLSEYARCRDCETGLSVLKEFLNQQKGDNEMTSEKRNNDIPEAKNPEEKKKPCKKCGVPKRLNEFPRNKICRDGHQNVCKDCRRKQRRAFREKQRLGTSATAPAISNDITSDPTPSAPHRNRLVIDLTNYPEVYERIEKAGIDEIRTPENQALYWLVMWVRAESEHEADGV